MVATFKTKMTGIQSTGNTSTTPLAANATFPGAWEMTKDFAIIYITVSPDVASATDGLVIQSSIDGVNVLDQDVFTITAGSTKTFSFQSAGIYTRVQYTNGGTIQGSFSLLTLYKYVYGKPSSHRIQDSIVDEDDAELVKAVLTGKANGSFVNVLTTVDGNLKISDGSSGLEIAKGNVTGHSFVHKFGRAPDFDTADGEVTIWDGAEDGTAWELMRYVYSTSADIDSISSSAADTQDITITGLDTNWESVTQTITLTGQTRKALDTNLIRVFRAFNNSSTAFTGHVFVYKNGALTAGVPNTNADIRLVLQPENQQTEMAVYSIPAGYTGYVRDWYASSSGANKNSNFPIRLYARNFGKVFRLKHSSALSDNGTSAYQHKYEEPEVFAEKTDIEMTCEMLAVGGTGASISGGFDIVLVEN
jgi:hypothetical protein